MLRLILSIVIVASSCFIGQYMAAKLHRREDTLMLFIRRLKTALAKAEYTACTVYEMFECFDFDREEPFFLQWDNMLELWKNELKKEDLSILREFGSQLGFQDTESQRKLFELTLTMLEENLSRARSDVEKKSKLFRILGFSAGMALSLLLI